MKIDLPKDVAEKILKQESEMLATHVVVNRVLGSFREEAKLAMIELMRRRMQGDEFDFESFIAKETDETCISLQTPSLHELKKEIIGKVVSQLFNPKQLEDEEDSSEETEKDEEAFEFDSRTQKDLDSIMEQLKIITS